jgi:hypothetical protein
MRLEVGKNPGKPPFAATRSGSGSEQLTLRADDFGEDKIDVFTNGGAARRLSRNVLELPSSEVQALERGGFWLRRRFLRRRLRVPLFGGLVWSSHDTVKLSRQRESRLSPRP